MKLISNYVFDRLVLKKLGNCDRSENVWRRLPDLPGPGSPVDKNSDDKSEWSYLTIDLKTKGLGNSISTELLKILKVKRLCDEFMKFMNHPAYVMSKRFKKPVECESNQSESDEEEKIRKIVVDHFNQPSEDEDDARTVQPRHTNKPNQVAFRLRNNDDSRKKFKSNRKKPEKMIIQENKEDFGEND